MTTKPPLALILTTEAGPDAASDLASELVERRLAACVTTSPVASTYRWDGEVVRGGEVQLTVKTTTDGVEDAVAAIEDLHSYDIPEIVVLDAGASGAYHDWVAGEVGAVTPPRS